MAVVVVVVEGWEEERRRVESSSVGRVCVCCAEPALLCYPVVRCCVVLCFVSSLELSLFSVRCCSECAVVELSSLSVLCALIPFSRLSESLSRRKPPLPLCSLCLSACVLYCSSSRPHIDHDVHKLFTSFVQTADEQ